MKLRIIFDNIDGVYYAQYKKWWYLTGWQTYQEQLNGHWGAATKPLKFRSFERAGEFITEMVQNYELRKKMDKEQKEKEKKRIKIISEMKFDVPAPEYYHYST